MYHIDINTSSGVGAAGMLRMILSAPGVEAVKARINTKAELPSWDSDSNKWPLIIECTSEGRDTREFEIRILCMKSGYSEETQYLALCLLYCGFTDIDINEIYDEYTLKREYVK